jgi:hypothetical protein
MHAGLLRPGISGEAEDESNAQNETQQALFHDILLFSNFQKLTKCGFSPPSFNELNT